MSFQSIAAILVVLATIAVMLYFRLVKKSGSCGEGCGCGSSTKNQSTK